MAHISSHSVLYMDGQGYVLKYRLLELFNLSLGRT